MSCGCNEPYNNVCRQDIPYPQVSHESVPSLIDNLVDALYGDITKSVVANRVVWNIPCDPASNPAEVPGLPRMEGEGLLCYIMRAFILFATEGFNINSPFSRWSFTGNGTTQSYNLPDAFGLLPNSYLVYIDGVVQDPVNFTISNTNPIAINFSTAIPNGSVVTIISLGGATPSTDVTDYTATPDNSSVSNTIGYWLAQSTFNQNSNYQVTGTPTARNLATRGGDVINVKDFGATGNGTTNDTAAIQAAITAAPAGAAIYFPRGSYLAAKILISKSITIFGDGMDVTEWVYSLNTGVTAGLPSADAYFVVSGQNTEFNISNGTIVDKFGFRYVGQDVITTAIGCTDAYSQVATTFPKKIQASNVKFVDFWDGIWLNTRNLIVENCNFVLTYGKASIGQPNAIGNPISGHPCCGILAVCGSSIIKNNKYDGLADNTFTNANTGYLNYRFGGDGLPLIQFRDWAYIAWNTNFDGKHECSNNVIVNHWVEAIQYAYSGATIPPITDSLVISNNSVRPIQKYFVDGWTFMPAIAVVLGSHTPNIKIVSNYIENTALGINVGSSAPMTGGYGNIEISNNVLNGVLTGIAAAFLTEKDIISNNTIFCQSKPVKDASAAVRSQGIPLSGATSSFSILNGLYIQNCNPLVTNNTLSAQYDFDVTTTLSSQASSVLTLANATGIQSAGWGILIKYQDQARFLPVTNVSGNNVTVDSAYLSGTTFPNGITVYASKGFTPFFGAINIVNQGSQVLNLNQAFYNTTIKGFLKDNSSTDVNGTGNSSTMVNTTAIDVYEKTSSSNPQPQFFKEDGFYYKF